MGRIPIDFLRGDDPAFPADEDEDDGAEACFRQELEVLIADEDDAPAELIAAEDADAHWARQRAQLYEQMEGMRRAAESAP